MYRIQPGDCIFRNYAFGSSILKHYGVYVGDGCVVHMTGDFWGGARIEQCTMEAFMQTKRKPAPLSTLLSSLRRGEDARPSLGVHFFEDQRPSPAEIVRLASLFASFPLERRQCSYNLTSRNCESFATWCCTSGSPATEEGCATFDRESDCTFSTQGRQLLRGLAHLCARGAAVAVKVAIAELSFVPGGLVAARAAYAATDAASHAAVEGFMPRAPVWHCATDDRPFAPDRPYQVRIDLQSSPLWLLRKVLHVRYEQTLELSSSVPLEIALPLPQGPSAVHVERVSGALQGYSTVDVDIMDSSQVATAATHGANTRPPGVLVAGVLPTAGEVRVKLEAWHSLWCEARTQVHVIVMASLPGTP